MQPYSPVTRAQVRCRPVRRALAILFAALALVMVCAAAALGQPSAAEVSLAERYAPIVKIPEASGCANGIPYEPIDVDLLFGNPEVALRGPWDRTNVVGVAPRAESLDGLFGYHLDFPGDALSPGCTYEEWSARLAEEKGPTAYAHITAEAGKPGLIALQYWFYYVFNDWNNNHEGDWEMIQIVFPADTPAEALRTTPVEVGYSQHSSAERAGWGDAKLQIEDGTHPVVYPAGGSHANFFGSELYLMRSSAEGVGCDDTRSVAKSVRPEIVTVPSARADYLRTQPWLGFEGRWGEKQAAFFNGPTGPNDKTQWTRPITWSQTAWRERSFTVPEGSIVGPVATDVFCGSVAFGSEVLRRAKSDPQLSLLALAVFALIVVWALTRTRWAPADTRGIERRRRWGQLVSCGARMYASRPRVFLGIGLLFVPLGVALTFLQYLLFQVSTLAPLVDEAGERNAFIAALAFGLGIAVSLMGFSVVQAATARAMVEIDAGRPVTALGAYRAILPRLRPLLRALAIAVAVQIVLGTTLVLILVGVYLIIRWSLIGVIAGIDPEGDSHLLRRSWALTRGDLWRVTTISLGVTGVALLTGPLVGTLVLIVSSAGFNVVNIVTSLVYVAALPFPAIVMTYLAGDLRARQAPEADAVPEPPAPEAAATPA